MIALIVVGVIVLILIIYVIATYNGLVNFKNKVQDSWAQIDVLLKRRNDLIPNLIETVKGYATHEKTTLDAVIQARNSAVNAKDPHEKMESANMLTEALGNLFALSENYPDLKANEVFKNLQIELTGTEDKIAFARQFYNDTVQHYNTAIMVFPNNIMAKLMKYKEKEYFKVQEDEKEVVEVKL